MDETDADGEWSDEEVLQSGSQTGLSETEQEDGQRAAVIQIQRPRPPFSGIVKNGQLTSSYPLSVPPSTDPVSVMMDKIDAELLAIEKEETKASRTRKLNDNVRANEIGQRYTNSGPPEVEFCDPRASGTRSIKESSNSDFLSFKKNLTTEVKDLNEPKIVPDVPKDLDPITASEIDAKFKEIMSKKKVPQSAHDQGRQLENLIARLRQKNASRPSATMLSSGGYATDNESVKTEDFESKFFSLMVNPTEAERHQTLVKRIEEEQTQHPMTDGAPHSILKVQLSRPRSCSPVRMREKKKPGYSRTDVFQQANIPTTATDRDNERRARSVSPSSKNRNFISSQKALTANSNVTFNPCLIKPTENVDITESTAAKSNAMDNTTQLLHQSEMEDLKSMRQTLSKTRQDLTQIEHTLLDTRELSEDAKSGLMMLEFKRGIVSQDLERLNEEMKRKQGQLTTLDAELQNKLEDLKTMKSLTVTKEECLEVKNLKEENRNLKTKLRNAESLQAERDELIRQLDATKEELFREQKHNRLQTVEVQEEMESLTSKVEEIQVGWAEDQDQLAKLQQAYRQMEKEKNELIKGKAQEYEQMKMSLKEEVNHIQQRMGKELSDLGNEVTELRLKVGQLTTDSASKDIQLKSSKEQVEHLQTVLAKERQEKTKAANNYKTALGQLKKEMSTAVSKMKDSMFLEKQKAVEDMKNELEQEHRELVKHHEDRLNQIMEDHLYQIAEKESQISNLHEVIRCQESQIQTEIDLQVHEALIRERALMEQETEWQLKKEREDSSRRINELTVQCERDKQVNKDLQAEVGNLKKELEDQKRLQREASKEKLLAVSKAKEQMKQQNNAEIERVKFNINQEHEHEFDQLREQLRMKEDEATQLCLEKQAALEREKQILQVLEQTERLIIGEINEECQKLSRLLGITVHNLSQSNYKPELSDSRQNITSRCIPVITSAMANLRSCNDHISSHVEELNAEVESLRSMMDAVIKEKEEAVESCKLEMERQKTLDLEMLKEKLLKDHVHEMSRVIQECASTNTQLRTNSEYLQRYGDAAMLEALQAKEDELHSLEQSMAQWKSETEERFNTQLQLMMAKEREKYQAVQHHTTREQNRINELQKREIERLEAEVEKLSMSQVKNTNKLLRSPSPTSSISQMSDSLSVPLSNPMSPGNLKSSQQYLQARIQQLQADNAALRKQRLLAAGQLGSSPTVTNTKGFRAISPKGQARISSPDSENVHWLTDKIKQGEKEAIKVKEQAKLNQKILNNRMDEMARLQNTLITQNQELQELERAYNDLHKHYNSRPSSPSRNLNVTV